MWQSQSGMNRVVVTLFLRHLLEKALQHESHSISADEPQTTLRQKEVLSFSATSSENRVC